MKPGVERALPPQQAIRLSTEPVKLGHGFPKVATASRRCDDPLGRGCVEIIVHTAQRGRPQETCDGCRLAARLPKLREQLKELERAKKIGPGLRDRRITR